VSKHFTIGVSESRNAKCQNPKSRRQFRKPGVEVSKHFTTGIPESRNAKCRNPESRRQFWITGFWIPGVGDVKNSYYRRLEVAKCEIAK
jgi:hypothetical protein